MNWETVVGAVGLGCVCFWAGVLCEGQSTRSKNDRQNKRTLRALQTAVAEIAAEMRKFCLLKKHINCNEALVAIGQWARRLQSL